MKSTYKAGAIIFVSAPILYFAFRHTDSSAKTQKTDRSQVLSRRTQQSVSTAREMPTPPTLTAAQSLDGRADQESGNVEVHSNIPETLTVAEERAKIERSLSDSGSTQEPWTATAIAMLQEWPDKVPEWVRKEAIITNGARCFKQGCVIEVQYTNAVRAQEAIELIGEVLSDWPGPRIQLAADSSKNPSHPENIFVLLTPNNG